MGIETNFGNYLGKMDILSSLATLSYDKRRSEFFSKELLIILKLIDQKKIDRNILYGSWAGAFGNFQFMPSTIEKYAIDYDKNNKIELKSINDSFASAANYLNKMGWKSNSNCFIQIELKENIPIKYLNVSSKLSFFAKLYNDPCPNISKSNLDVPSKFGNSPLVKITERLSSWAASKIPMLISSS